MTVRGGGEGGIRMGRLKVEFDGRCFRGTLDVTDSELRARQQGAAGMRGPECMGRGGEQPVYASCTSQDTEKESARCEQPHQDRAGSGLQRLCSCRDLHLSRWIVVRVCDGGCLREVEAAVGLVDGDEEAILEHRGREVLGQLEVVGARHYTRQLLLRRRLPPHAHTPPQAKDRRTVVDREKKARRRVGDQSRHA